MNISFRLLMILDKTGKMSKPSLINPENDAAVNVTKTWEMDSSPYTDNAIAYHTSTDWEIRSSSTDVTSDSLLYSSYTDTSNLTSINVILSSPYTIPRPIYARVRYWAGSISSDWSDFIEIKSEYCTPFSPTSGYTPYEVTHSAWGDSTSFMNKHAIWVEEDGQTNDILIGSIVSVYIKLTLSASDNLYTIQYACDDDCQVICSSSSQYQYIVNWGGSNNSSPGLNSRGWESGITSNFTLPAGNYTFTFNLFNGPSGGTTWSTNPGGSAFVISETTSGTVISDSASWQGASNVEAVFCSGGTLGADEMCHCISSNMTTPSVSTNISPIYLDAQFNLIGSPYIDSNLTSHLSTDWEIYTEANQSGRALVNDTNDSTNLTTLSTTIPLASDITSPIYARVKYNGKDGNLSSAWSSEKNIPLEYKTPFAPLTGYKIYKVTDTAWNNFMPDAPGGPGASSDTFQNNHAVWVGNTDSNDVLIGDIMSVYVSITFPEGGNYSVTFSTDDSCQVRDQNGNIIIKWNQGWPSQPDEPGAADVGHGAFPGSPDGINVNFSTTPGTQIFTVNMFNSPKAGTTWSENPGGSGFVFYDQPDGKGNVISDSANWPNDSSIKLFFCKGGEIDENQKCHCYTYNEAVTVNNYNSSS